MVPARHVDLDSILDLSYLKNVYNVRSDPVTKHVYRVLKACSQQVDSNICIIKK